tara:strand:- start:1514 stop:2623 length:1110 start_codon:yes stop_codon:yes gene_type:complete
MAIQVINGVPLNTTEGFDKVTDTQKITAGYHNGTALLSHAAGAYLITQSISATRENYYFNIAEHEASSSLWSVSYGHVMGTGSNTDSNNVMGETEAIYRQWAQTLLAPNEVTGGFFISHNKSLASAPTNKQVTGRDEEIYVLIAKRELMKDRLNKKNWLLQFSGSNHTRAAAPAALHLTDDSATTTPVATPAGPRYNIVSGSSGTVISGAADTTYGFFYPDQGVMVFSGAELAHAVPGYSASRHDIVGHKSGSQVGFMAATGSDKNYKTGLRLVNALEKIQFRNEEDQTSVSYFCRARSGGMNFSNNPTFVSGSMNEIRHDSMKGNPNVFITGVELYDANGDMVATGKLSTPLKKNFSSEATIKTKITF